MLVKSELKEIPICEVPQLTKQEKKQYSFISSACVHTLKRSGEILVVDYFDPKSDKLQLRFFANKKSKQYISFDVENDKWETKATCKCLLDKVGSLGKIYDEKIVKTVTSYFKGLDRKYSDSYYHQPSYIWIKGMLALCENFCQDIRDERNAKRYDRQVAREKFLHSLFLEKYPKRIDEYCKKHIFSENYVFFSNLDKNRQRKGKCSKCGKSFNLPAEIKHNEKTECPKCHCKAHFCAERYADSKEDKSQLFVVFKKAGYILYEYNTVFRRFNCNLEAFIGYDTQYQTVYNIEKDKYLSSSWTGSAAYWGMHWSYFKQWVPSNHIGFVYPGNLDSVFGKDYFHIDIKKAISACDVPINIFNLLFNIKEFPVVEYLCKMGLTPFASKVNPLTLNCEGKNFAEVMGVSKQYLPLYRDMNITPEEHLLIPCIKEFVTPELLNEFRELGISEYHYQRVMNILEHMTLRKLINYMYKQCAIAKRLSDITPYNPSYQSPVGHFIGCFSDYISMSEELDIHLDKSNLFPKDIYRAHDVLVSRVNAVRKEMADKASKEALIFFNDFFSGYSKNGLTVVVPHSKKDFIREGQELCHCVGGTNYYKNHIKGEKMIFFIRKADDIEKSYFTAEIDMVTFNVIQLRGRRNCPPRDDVRIFTKEFAKWLKKQKLKIRKEVA